MVEEVDLKSIQCRFESDQEYADHKQPVNVYDCNEITETSLIAMLKPVYELVIISLWSGGETVNALHSKCSTRKGLGVRFPFGLR